MQATVWFQTSEMQTTMLDHKGKFYIERDVDEKYEISAKKNRMASYGKFGNKNAY